MLNAGLPEGLAGRLGGTGEHDDLYIVLRLRAVSEIK